MNSNVLRVFLLVLAAFVIAVGSFGAMAKKRAIKSKTVSNLAPDIVALVNTPLSSYDDCKALKSKMEMLANPYFKSSYNRKAKTAEQKTMAVMSRLDKYATDKLEVSSNFDMADAGYIHNMNHTYNTLAAYNKLLNKTKSSNAQKAVQDEVEAWLKVQSALQSYCANSSYLTNFGGSMAILGVAGSGWRLAEMRERDVNVFLKNGFGADKSSASMGNITSKAATMVIDMDKRANELIEMIEESERESNHGLFESVSEGIKDATNKLTIAMPQWMEARQRMLEYSKNPEDGIKATGILLDAISSLALYREE